MADDASPVPKMTTILNSSNVHSVGHDGSALLVRFKGSGGLAGQLYRYAGVPASEVQAIIDAASPGAYLRASIIGKRSHEKVDGPEG